MYDLFRQKKDSPETPVFLMRAPLTTISEFLNLHVQAEKRIIAELAQGPICMLFDSRRYPTLIHVVSAATGVR